MRHFNILLCKKIYISTAQYTRSPFFPEGSGNSISSHKRCANAIPVRNEEFSPCNFSINPLKNRHILKKKEKIKETNGSVFLTVNKQHLFHKVFIAEFLGAKQ